MRISLTIILLFQLVLLTTSTVAAIDELQINRQLYLQAEKLIKRPNSEKYLKLEQQLHNYPLYPYLQQSKLLNNMSIKNSDLISKFLIDYRNTPLDWPLRKKWLKFLARNKQYQTFLDFYQPSNDTKMTCRYYLYQLKTGVDESLVLPHISTLWLNGKSQPKLCDPLFVRWTKAGYRTDEMIMQRLILAATIGKHTLIPYLTKLLPENKQYIGNLWHKVRRDPSYVTRLKRFPKKNQLESEVVIYGLKRFIWRDPDRTIRTFNQATSLFKFSEQQLQGLYNRFALALASKKHKDADFWLHQINNENLSDNIIQWRIANALRTHNWKTVQTEINALPADKFMNNNWQYWLARSLIEMGDKDAGNKIFSDLAKKRHYYGFLAAGKLGQSVALESQPLIITDEERLSVMQFRSAQRAIELFKLDRYVQARREWNYLLAQITDRQKLVVSKITNEQGWYDRAIFTLPDVGYLNDIELRFPEAFGKHINHYSKTHNINPAWAFVVARRESSFMPDAHSSEGARGLMQVLPMTARQLYKRKRLDRYLYKPKTNIDVGTKYLNYLLRRHNDNLVLATAAYNAGSYRVKTWLKKQPDIAADIWIETIPYKETREYVKSVMAYQQIYQSKTDPSIQMFVDLSSMKISN